MMNYIITWLYDDEGGPEHFRFSAEDRAHAVEQALPYINDERVLTGMAIKVTV